MDLLTAITAASAMVRTLSLAAYLEQQPSKSPHQGYTEITERPEQLARITEQPPTGLIRTALEYIVVRDGTCPPDDAGIRADRLLENMETSAGIMVRHGLSVAVSTDAGTLPLAGLLGIGELIAKGDLEPEALTDSARRQTIVAALQREFFGW